MPLCKQHYHAIYNKLHPIQTHCSICQISLKHSSPKPCPQPSIIEDYLKTNMGLECSIGENDMVCYSCYRSYLFILKHSKKISTDRDLREHIDILENRSHTIHSSNELIEQSVNQVIAAVGRVAGRECITSSRCLWLVLQFCWWTVTCLTNMDISKLVTSANILSNLIATLEHHITFARPESMTHYFIGHILIWQWT